MEWRFSYQVVGLWLNLQHVLKFYRMLLVWISIYSPETTGSLWQPPLWLPPLPSQHQLRHELFIFFWLHLPMNISGFSITTSTLPRCLPICVWWNSSTALSTSVAVAATFVYSGALFIFLGWFSNSRHRAHKLMEVISRGERKEDVSQGEERERAKDRMKLAKPCFYGG